MQKQEKCFAENQQKRKLINEEIGDKKKRKGYRKMYLKSWYRHKI